MIQRTIFKYTLIYLVLNCGYSTSAQVIFPAPPPADSISMPGSAHGSTASLKSDLLRSAVGMGIGGIVGAAIGGIAPILLGKDYENDTFPDNSFYLRSYIGASFFAALSSSAALYLTKNRDISYWRLAGYSLLPPMVLVLPLSVYASAKDREELVRSTWIATMASLGITAAWNVLVYRMQPPKAHDGFKVHFGGLFPYAGSNKMSLNKSISIGVSLVEIQF